MCLEVRGIVAPHGFLELEQAVARAVVVLALLVVEGAAGFDGYVAHDTRAAD